MKPEDGVAAAPDPVSEVLLDRLFGDRRDLADLYHDELCTTGIDHGLVGPREAPRMWDRHIVNSALIHEVVPEGASVVDIGSGAGLPGIPLALARPDCHVTLVEPLERRVVWLKRTISLLGLDIDVLRSKAHEQHGRLVCDVATSRAVAALDKLLAWSGPLVRPGGVTVCIKGQSADDELAKSQTALRKNGFERGSVVICGQGYQVTGTTVIVATKKAPSAT